MMHRDRPLSRKPFRTNYVSTQLRRIAVGAQCSHDHCESGSRHRETDVTDRRFLLLRWDEYPAGATVTGAGLAPAESTRLTTAYLDQHRPVMAT
jgi:hypothetical protein